MAQQHEYPALEVDALQIGYHKRPLMGPINFVLPRGSFNVLIGANGAGKSTLLQTLSGSLKPIGGRILIDGCDINALSHKELAKRLSLVFTDRLTSGGLTVREVVKMGRHPHTGLLGRLSADDRAIVDKAMEDVGISHKADAYLSDTSDGERQKAMIARTLAQQTPLLLLDEPTNFLDVASRLELLDMIRRLVDDKGITAIISTHDIASSIVLADNVITMLPHDDKPVSADKCGSPEALRRLDGIFSNRGIVFDSGKNDFTYQSRD